MTRVSPARLLSLPLLAALALVTTAADAGPSARSANSSPAAAGAAQPSAGLPGIAFPMVSKQSIYLPCYAFVPLVGGPFADWRAGRSACYLMKENKDLLLAAPLHFPVTSTKARVTKLRCYVGDANGTDEVHIDASVQAGAIELAELHAVQKTDDDNVELVGTVNHDYDHDEIDAVAHHYDLSLRWKVAVPQGKGWMPQSNLFRGCRVDYVVDNLP